MPIAHINRTLEAIKITAIIIFNLIALQAFNADRIADVRAKIFGAVL